MRIIYSLIWWCLLPVILVYFAWRAVGDSRYRSGLMQRFSFYPQALKDKVQGCTHIHCASMGEVNAAAPLIRALKQAHPHRILVVTTTTPTGAEQVYRLFADEVIHVLAPLDGFLASWRFARYFKPQTSIFTEVELWPNWIMALKQQHTKLYLVNARLSKSSCTRYWQFRGLFLPVFACFDKICAQNKTIEKRYQRFTPKVMTSGNLKFDIKLPEYLPEKTAEFYQQHALNRQVWVAASVHPDEYQQVLQAHSQILQQYPNTLLILVPRHPERFSEVAQYLTQYTDMKFVCRSTQEPVTDKTSVWLVDSMGELIAFYALAKIAYVGGSLVNVGGHNPLEPAALAKAILMGPNQTNCADICQQLIERGALHVVNNSADIVQQVLAWFASDSELHRAALAATDVVMCNQGAVQKTMHVIDGKYSL
ncbi:3-deoxy-D-manno-octulosonic-acid transferase [Catenovulum agarivorans DS-2]|uniref:3-deoxy-D-manno-octulosonic acid transferase n=1 Tax=Catenovulum agarivorans DS-2 TaxID=1328313 RepID=W7QE66_9ALTE|nr:3-deoxy-D-manno-octulosonic acid transferase [Catenovulum agarivorans]EWH11189.1 3-deoxy-D-manno-octulosonic-acid transferase [Catenovulum agarivorans DS-2]